MNILVNCSNLKIGGGIQVAHSFISQLTSYDEHTFLVVTSSKLMKQIDLSKFTDFTHISFIEYSIKPSLRKAFSGRDRTLSELEEKNNIDRVFTIFGPSYWRPKSKHICGFAKAQYIYADSPFFDIMSKKEALKLKVKKILHMISFTRTAEVFITELWDISEKLKILLPNKEVHTVTNTYNQIFDKDTPKCSKKLSDFDGTTLLTISANYPHKNLEILPQVISYMKKMYEDFKFRFVLTLEQDVLNIVDPIIQENIEFIGRVDINECPGLYRQSDFMFLPTLLECFSASYAEAMKMEVPILTSDLPFARSICGEAAEYFDPLNAEDIGDGIYNLSKNIERQEELKRLGLNQLERFDTFETRAKKYIEIVTKE